MAKGRRSRTRRQQLIAKGSFCPDKERLDRRDGTPQDPADLVVRKPVKFLQNDGQPLVGGQALQGGEDPAALLLRQQMLLRRAGAIPPVRKFVIVTLAFNSGVRMDEGLLVVRRLHRIQAEIDRDAIDPGGEFCLWFVPCGGLPYSEEDLLGHILGLIPIAEGTVDQIQNVLLMAPHQDRESRPVAPGDPAHEPFIG